MCHRKVKLNIGFVSEPTPLNNKEAAKVPISTPNTILQEATRVHRSKSKPTMINKVEVSPIDPGIFPIKASIHK